MVKKLWFLANFKKGETMMHCCMDFLSYKTYDKQTYVTFHKHSCYELVYYIKGSGKMNLDEKVLEYSANTFTITQPGFFHDEKHIDETEVLYIGFSYDGQPMELKNGLYVDGFRHTVLSLLEEMKYEILKKSIYYNIKLDLLVKELLVEIARMFEEDSKRGNELLYIKKFMRENFNQQIDLHTLAELSGYSYHHFRHLFKKETGLSPINYIIDLKIEHAKHMLSQSKFSISAIAQECGFSCDPQFCSMFKKVTGKTPSEFRKSFRALP